MPRKINEHLIPLRAWVATVKRADGSRITTTIYGRNCSQAELDYRQANQGTQSVVVHQENWR